MLSPYISMSRGQPLCTFGIWSAWRLRMCRSRKASVLNALLSLNPHCARAGRSGKCARKPLTTPCFCCRLFTVAGVRLVMHAQRCAQPRRATTRTTQWWADPDCTRNGACQGRGGGGCVADVRKRLPPTSSGGAARLCSVSAPCAAHEWQNNPETPTRGSSLAA